MQIKRVPVLRRTRLPSTTRMDTHADQTLRFIVPVFRHTGLPASFLNRGHTITSTSRPAHTMASYVPWYPYRQYSGHFHRVAATSAFQPQSRHVTAVASLSPLAALNSTSNIWSHCCCFLLSTNSRNSLNFCFRRCAVIAPEYLPQKKFLIFCVGRDWDKNSK